MTEPDERDVLRVLRSRAETRAYYDKLARVYDLLADAAERPMRAKGLELLGAAPGERVVEPGCGTGTALVALAAAVAPTGFALGVDLAEAMIAVARDRLEREAPAAPAGLVCADAAALPLRDAAVDAVFMSFTLELFDTPEIPVVLAECRRVLRPGGRIALVALSRESPDLAVRLYEWTHRHFPNLLDCRPIHARRALEAAGFAIRAHRLEHMWMPVEIVLGVREPTP